MNSFSFSEMYSSVAHRTYHIDKEEIIFIVVLWGKNKGFFNIKGYLYAKRMSLYIILYTYTIYTYMILCIYSRYDVWLLNIKSF